MQKICLIKSQNTDHLSLNAEKTNTSEVETEALFFKLFKYILKKDN